jgi:hypothetical protein
MLAEVEPALFTGAHPHGRESKVVGLMVAGWPAGSAGQTGARHRAARETPVQY